MKGSRSDRRSGWARIGAGAVIAALLVALPARAQVATPSASIEVANMGTTGPALLLIPCMSCRWRSFDTFMERNHERYRMWAVTLPGFGGTPVPDLPMNTNETVWHDHAVTELSRWIDREAIDSIIIVGHSFGGDIAVKLAARRADVVRAVIFLDSWPFSDRSWFHEEPAARRAQADSTVAQQSARFADLDVWQQFNTPTHSDPERRLLYHGWFMATPMPVVLQYWRENSLSDLNRIWRDIRVPALDVKAVSASADPARARTARLDQLRANGLAGRVRTVFVDSAHHFVHESRPETVDRLIAEFIAGLAR